MSQFTQGIAPILTVVNGVPTCLSTEVARHFGKQHRNVLRAIENLQGQLDKRYALNFERIQIDVDLGLGRTRKDSAYRLTKDGFTLLTMGFTGKKALRFKLAYMDAFNRMEAKLQQSAVHFSETAPIDVRALLLDGQANPTVKRPAAIDKAIDKRAWDLAHDAFELIREHLQRRIAHDAEKGHPVRKLDLDTAAHALESVALDDALAHVWVEKIHFLRMEAEYYFRTGQKLIAELAALDRTQPAPRQPPPKQQGSYRMPRRAAPVKQPVPTVPWAKGPHP